MKLKSWELKLAAALVTFSLSVYTVKFFLLGDPKNTYMYVFNALGFLPINVLLVTLVLNKLLSIRAKKEREDKINVIAGIFFSDFGSQLLALFAGRDPDAQEIKEQLRAVQKWEVEEHTRLKSVLARHSFNCRLSAPFLSELRNYLTGKKDFLLRLLENPALLENESFTACMLALFHLLDELESRTRLEDLPESDLKHLAQDTQRAYRELSFYWLKYLAHLKKNYPYLYSLAVRMNPYDQDRSPVVLA